MKQYSKQHGATLIIILLIVLIIMSITTISLDMSILELKSTSRLKMTRIDFYRAENCLNQAAHVVSLANEALPHSSACSHQSCIHDYRLLYFRQLNINWWETHAYLCQKNIWSYTELLSEKTHDDYTFYRITVYYYPYGWLQMTIGKSFTLQRPIIRSWQNASM